jgi:hypothetical protein
VAENIILSEKSKLKISDDSNSNTGIENVLQIESIDGGIENDSPVKEDEDVPYYVTKPKFDFLVEAADGVTDKVVVDGSFIPYYH